MKKSIILLSSGMDSTTALYEALNRTEVRAVIVFDYGQRGSMFELGQARKIYEDLPRHDFEIDQDWDNMDFLVMKFQMNAVSALFQHSFMKTNAGEKHWAKFGQKPLPATFVPARNLIMLSMAAGLAWTLNCEQIWGGWSGVDVEYPDCSNLFIHCAQEAINAALGLFHQSPRIHIIAPLLNKSKVETVKMGEEMEVPWELTRSCYTNQEGPCLTCDSCELRVEAFLEAGVVDPTVPSAVWEGLTADYSYEGG